SLSPVSTCVRKMETVFQQLSSSRFGRLSLSTKTKCAQGNLNPTAVVPIVKLGLQRFKEPNNLTADASVVNPTAKPASKKR
ncbi:MAG: hypothetical protein LWX01_05785, partial [Deltaproteobacteria bacterium]|nr:hypothetical protein [Deltaproteobacteria bacterium]MDL1961197.1 hypothetical protein [Deltaproteobacteria bacterium]